MKNHRGETVVSGDPERGTYRFIANEARICMNCGCTINEGEEAEEDLVLICSSCCDKFDKPKKRYVLAVYELDRSYGGPEEGGWWYDTGQLIRVLAVYRDENKALAHARRFNRTLAYRRKQDPHFRSLSSVAYSGGHLAARVEEGTAPEFFPQHRPYYE